jgi:hypothetical protein
VKIRDRKQLISSKLEAAILRYFHERAANGGSFRDTASKQEICDTIILRATGLYQVTILPGAIILTDSKGRSARISSGNFQPILNFTSGE